MSQLKPLHPCCTELSMTVLHEVLHQILDDEIPASRSMVQPSVNRLDCTILTHLTQRKIVRQSLRQVQVVERQQLTIH